MFVETGGVRLHVEDDAGNPEGTPVVLLHGFTGSVADWDPLVDGFREAGRVIRIDLLGHGASDAPDDAAAYAMGACVHQVLGVLDHLGIWQADWVGYSMGGRVALHAAVRAPARVRRLVLEGASPGLADPLARAERAAEDAARADRLERDGVEAFVDDWMQHPLFQTQRRLGDAWWRHARSMRCQHTARGLAGSLRGLGVGVQAPLHARLRHLTAPTLLVTGALDLKFTRIAQAMHERMPASRHTRVSDAGHNVHVERPDDYLHAVGPWLLDPEITRATPGGS